jgi:hypothetical protein
LAFQPYFTSTAANVGWGWWSHDIGGHWGGIEDPELYLRWVQCGVFSPILRLHSTKNPYHDRRPWGHGEDVFSAAHAAMRLRHRLIPYIASMGWRAAQSNLPLVLPMYYLHPEDEVAYHCPNQYYFGSELLVAPYVAPSDPDTRLSRQVIWLPSGDWIDFASGERYAGGCWQAFYGGMGDIPVLAKAGAIVPLGPDADWSANDIPTELDVLVFPGADNTFSLIEDDGETQAYRRGDVWETRFQQMWRGKELELTVRQGRPVWAALKDDAQIKEIPSWLPAERRITLRFRGISQPAEVSANLGAVETTYDAATETLILAGIGLHPHEALSVLLRLPRGSLLGARDRRSERCRDLLRSFRLDSLVKQQVDSALPDLLAGRAALDDYAAALKDGHLAALRAALG